MILACIIYHLSGDMAPPVDINSPLAGYPRVLLVWFYIQSHSKSLMLKIIGEDRQKIINAQRNLR